MDFPRRMARKASEPQSGRINCHGVIYACLKIEDFMGI